MNAPECPFEVHGYFEELVDAKTFRLIGTRNVDQPERPLGSSGTAEIVITENVELRRGHKTVTLKASKRNPVRVHSTFQMICGRVKNK